MLLAALASLQRVLGPAHPTTLAAARYLEDVRAHIRATPPTNVAAPAAAGAARLLLAGTRVLKQRLVAKREHNGEPAWCRSTLAPGGGASSCFLIEVPSVLSSAV